MFKRLLKLKVCLLLILFLLISTVFAQAQMPVEPVNKKPETSLKFKISTRQGIYRNRSPIMVDLLFINDAYSPQRICTYKFYEALLKVDVYDSKGKRIDFNPKLLQLQLERISGSDWVEILPGRVYKKSFSLTKKIIDSTGYRLKPGNYRIKATYEGCSKFDNTLPAILLKSNMLHILVTE